MSITMIKDIVYVSYNLLKLQCLDYITTFPQLVVMESFESIEKIRHEFNNLTPRKKK